MLHHSNARGLAHRHAVTHSQSKDTVSARRSFEPLTVAPYTSGVNPHGLQANELWQSDVTHIPGFGKLSYVHVTVDTFSRYMWATTGTREKVIHVIAHFLKTFAILGIPQCIKTDNGPAYVSHKVACFFAAQQITPLTGIPYNPQGQGGPC